MRRYAAKVSWGNPTLHLVVIDWETPSFYYVRSAKPIFGGWEHFNIGGRTSKAGFEWFETQAEAVDYLVEKLRRRIDNLYAEIDDTHKNLAELKEL